MNKYPPPKAPSFFLRSSLFNLCFYLTIAVFCIILLPLLILPRKIMMSAVYIFIHTTAFFEKYILGLSYEIRGTENLPKEPPYIIAAKHQSAYETFKLHFLFKDPATILKRELLKIPLWGIYLKKSDVIAIDRSSPKAAITSMQKGAKRVAAQKRPIVIFPQGTRVPPGIDAKEKPYKGGVAHIQKALGLPVIPMATNAGVFYPKNTWCKKPGIVTFEFLPPIKSCQTRKTSETTKILETALEKKSNELIEEACNSLPKTLSGKKYFTKISLTVFLSFFIIYSAFWLYLALNVHSSYKKLIADIKTNPEIIEVTSEKLRVTGYPGKMKIYQPNLRIENYNGIINIKDIKAKSWIFPNSTISAQSSDITIKKHGWKTPLEFDYLNADFKFSGKKLEIKHSILKSGETTANLSGEIITPPPPSNPVINLDISIRNFSSFLSELVALNMVEEGPAMIASFALKALTNNEKALQTTISTQGNQLYLGPILIYQFPNNAI